MGGGKRAKKLRKLIYGSFPLSEEDRQYTRRKDGAVQSTGRRFIYQRAKELKK